MFHDFVWCVRWYPEERNNIHSSDISSPVIILFLGFYSPIECILLYNLFRGVHMLNEGTMVRFRKQPFLG